MKKPLVGLPCAVVAFFFVFTSQVHGGTPLETVEKRVSAALSVLSDPALKGDTAKKKRKETVGYCGRDV